MMSRENETSVEKWVFLGVGGGEAAYPFSSSGSPSSNRLFTHKLTENPSLFQKHMFQKLIVSVQRVIDMGSLLLLILT
ncbi:hypothetical protein TB2_011938 [Malus domestica]